jgi:hypothetical protein
MDKRTGKKKKNKVVKPENQDSTAPQQAPVIVQKKTDTKHK